MAKACNAVEKENLSLKRELFSRAEEIQVKILERDLSTPAALKQQANYNWKVERSLLNLKLSVAS
ncbi:hypothetical protein NC652_013199 [Populus alba x Populus x berolinensis]|nr:hypothetical protein NC652_013199 [Populus alba x Populus x berolinensis]